MDLIDLPDILHPYRDEILRTVRPCNQLVMEGNNIQDHPWSSRAGPLDSLPYLPLDQEYPVSSDDKRPLLMLAQINFSEMPELDGFPKEGLLQIFISDQFDVMKHQWGRSMNHFDMANFRVRYYPTILEDTSRLHTKEGLKLPEFQFAQWIGMPIRFERRYQIISDSDARFYTLYSKELVEKLLYSMPERKAYVRLTRPLSQIGGYHSSQNGHDPRVGVMDANSALLLQLDAPFSWADDGTGSFFIEEKELKALSFDRVLYHWDCT